MKKLIILSSIFIAFINVSYSQISIKLGPELGLTSPTVDYSGDAKDFYAGTKYGLRSGLHYGIMGKVQLGPLNGRLSISYASLDNNGNANPEQPNSTLEIKNNVFMFTLGTEFGFGIPFSPVKPYAGIDVLFSTISGTYNFQGTSEVSSGEKSIKSASRTGLGFAIGSEVAFGKSFTLDLSLRYNLINLFGKSYDGVTNSNNRDDAYTNLNDGADPNYSATNSKHPIGNDRSVATIQLNVGLLFGF
ncbi:MAG TPA: outer membrane beta-barrel protein [Ignavibacteria bacterium]|nr:outer membrane beta-barrel protein [Ignavibacteria bacterium]